MLIQTWLQNKLHLLNS